MKILYLTDNLDPHAGWGRYSLGVVGEVKRRGFRLGVLTKENLPKPKSPLAFLRNCLRTRKEAKDYDIVHALDTWPFGVYAWFAVLGTDKRLFINAVGTYSVAPLSHFFKRTLISWAYRRAGKVFAISNYVADLVREKLKTDKLQTVYLGLSPLPEPSSQDLEWARGVVNKHTPVLLTVGAVEARKGQKDVAQVVKILSKEHPNLLYLMAGVNADRAYLESIGQGKNVLYVPDANTDTKLAALYQCSDVFVLVSKRFGDHVEGFGLAALEAASFGLPVVGSRDSGVAEAFKDGYNGVAASAGNPEEIAKAIRTALANKQDFGEHSRQWAKRFSWVQTAEQYLTAYQQ